MEETNDMGFEQAMQGAFEGFGEVADAHVWNNIEAAIAPQKKRGAIWWWTGAAASIAVLVTFVLLNQKDLNYQSRQEVGLSDTANYDPCLNEPVMNNENGGRIEGDQTTNPNAGSGYAHSGDRTKLKTAPTATTGNVDATNRTTVNNEGNGFIADNNDPSFDPRNPLVESSNEVNKRATDYLEFLELGTLAQRLYLDSMLPRVEDEIVIRSEEGVEWQDFDQKPADQWALAANLGSSGASESARPQSTGFSFTADPTSGIESLADQSARSSQNIKYQAPFIIGIRGNWGFSRRWSLESGCSYSLLPGVIESASNNVQRVNRYSDHFLGIPMLIRFQFIDRKRIGFYTSAGILFEKGIASRNVLTTTIGTQTTRQIIKDKAPGIQMGAQLGLGVDYRINKLFSLYAEPSITSWGSNQSVPLNIRTAQLLWPSLNLGARFNLN